MGAVTTSRVPAVIDYLVATFNAAATLGQASTPVTVIDGPAVTADPGPLALWVGVDGIDPNGNPMPTAATSIQSRGNLADLGGQTRNETISVPCVALAQGGTDDVRALRVAVAGIVAAVDALVRADPKLGGNVISTMPGVAAAQWRQGPSPRGMAAQVTFTIDAETQI
jgi:hypothetical protein